MKYKFNNRKEALQKVDALPTPHSHTIKHYAEEDQYIVEEYHVDVLWKDLEETDEEGNVSVDHPHGWKTYAIDLDSEGMHGFMGVSYQENKM
jgi:hypothetical protein